MNTNKRDFKLHSAFNNAVDSYLLSGFSINERSKHYRECFAVIQKNDKKFLLIADFQKLTLELFTYPKKRLLSQSSF